MAVTGRGFLQGLATGVFAAGALGVAAIYVLETGALDEGSSTLAQFRTLVAWLYRNLGLSIPVFALLAVLFAHSLGTLKRRLAEKRPVEEVTQAEHLTDVWTSLFFGVGVIWTAIGMRGALLFALGDPDSTVQEGAFALLERMVDGGILLALSTTIFGGIGGYLMRVVKTLAVGADLTRYYDEMARSQGDRIQSTLGAIERQLKLVVRGSTVGEEHGDEQPSMAAGNLRAGF